jgi:hypothetical protein
MNSRERRSPCLGLRSSRYFRATYNEHTDWECGGSTDISDTNVLGAPCMILRHLRLGR